MLLVTEEFLLLGIFYHLDSSFQGMVRLIILLALERICTLNRQKNVILVFNVYLNLLLENEPLIKNTQNSFKWNFYERMGYFSDSVK